MAGKVILLNGPSSSGKSSLAAALRSLILKERNELYGTVSIDDLMKISTDETIYEDDVYDITEDMAREITEQLETADGVIVDHVITSERIYTAFLEAVGSCSLFTVHVSCSAEELLRREQARGNRHEGSALASLEYLYPKDGYDLTVDTTDMNTQQCASLVLKAAFPAMPDDLRIEKVDRDTPLAEKLLQFVENCSWEDVRDHAAQMIRNWEFTDWETMFAAVTGGEIAGMASVLKTDYYPLPDIFPWVSCIFVDERYRGRRISGELISYANRYLRDLGFRKSYIPSEFTGLYEKYGYRYVRDIVNYGGGTDHLFEKDLSDIPERHTEIIGKNYYGTYTRTRNAARGIVIDGDLILISYENATGQWMIPGGGLDNGENWSDCCVREVSEETGYLIEPSHCVLELCEYYEDCRYVTRYFIGTVTGQTDRKPTERETEAGMEPRWFSISDALAEFSTHERYDGIDEMRRGLYEREHTALTELFGKRKEKQG